MKFGIKLLKTSVLLFCLIFNANAQYQILHHFNGGDNDGASPNISLIQSGSTFFGMTFEGGSNNNGTIFRINADGNEFRLLYSFVSAAIGGQNPLGSLLLSDTILYGMASSTDVSGGTIFRIDTNGSDFNVLRQFTGNDGEWPYGTPILCGSVIYGMNTYGGNDDGYNGSGTIFRINTDGTDFHLLHTFMRGANDGSAPHGSLIRLDQFFYGTTLWGGTRDSGAIFRIDTNGSDFQLLHSFTGQGSDGTSPVGDLLQSGSVFYGMTYNGGSSNNGAIFKMNIDGSAYQLLCSFTGNDDGKNPFGSLIRSGDVLFGMTRYGTNSNSGTIFQINTDGTDFRVLHTFSGGNTDGAKPMGSLIFSDSTLFGMANSGGSHNKGVIFSLDLHGITDVKNIDDNKKSDIAIYPNPIYDQLTISFGTTPVKETVVQLYSIQGRLVFSKAFYNTSRADVDLAGLPNGMYLTRVMVEGNIFENKIIKTQ